MLDTTLLWKWLLNLMLMWEFTRKKVSVWMGLCGSGAVIGQIFFKDNLSGNAYVNSLNTLIIPKLIQIHGNRINRMWWIQDGAPCHRTIRLCNLLAYVFNTRIIAVNHKVQRPPITGSNNLWFLPGEHLKTKISSTPPANAQYLTDRLSDKAQLLRKKSWSTNEKETWFMFKKRWSICGGDRQALSS